MTNFNRRLGIVWFAGWHMVPAIPIGGDVGPLLEPLAASRQVIAVELQGHGHTADTGADVRIPTSKRNRTRRGLVRCAQDERLADIGGERAPVHLLLHQLGAGHQPARACLAQQLGDLLALKGRIHRGEVARIIDAAYHATTKSMLFGAHNATTSPARTP